MPKKSNIEHIREGGVVDRLDHIPFDDEPDDDEPLIDFGDNDDSLGFRSLEDEDDTINVLYWGREGTGKTTNACLVTNLEGVKKVLVISAEGGLKKIALKKRGVDTNKLVIWPPQGESVTFEGLVRVHQRVLSDLIEVPDSWGAVVIDSGTEIVDAVREQATMLRQNSLTRQNKDFDPNFVDRSDYGVMTDQLRRIFRRFRNLPCHVIMTALERYDDDNDVLGPAFTPELGKSVLGYNDLVLYCRADLEAAGEATEDDDRGAEFRALTRPTSKYRAKDRFDILPRVLANPDFVRLAMYVEGDLTEDEDELQQGYLGRQKQRDEERKQAEAERKAKREAARKTAKKG
jgi:hypothetical protein